MGGGKEDLIRHRHSCEGRIQIMQQLRVKESSQNSSCVTCQRIGFGYGEGIYLIIGLALDRM